MTSTTAPALAKLIAGLEALGPWRVGLDTDPQDFENGRSHVVKAAKLFDAYFEAAGKVLSQNSYAGAVDDDHTWDDVQSALDKWGMIRRFDSAYEQAVTDNSAFTRACDRADLAWKER